MLILTKKDLNKQIGLPSKITTLKSIIVIGRINDLTLLAENLCSIVSNRTYELAENFEITRLRNNYYQLKSIVPVKVSEIIEIKVSSAIVEILNFQAILL